MTKKEKYKNWQLQQTSGKLKAYFVKCFFFAASSFLVHGVNMLSVGETYVGFLFQYISIAQSY